jgi:hypothetical protein
MNVSLRTCQCVWQRYFIGQQDVEIHVQSHMYGDEICGRDTGFGRNDVILTNEIVLPDRLELYVLCVD